MRARLTVALALVVAALASLALLGYLTEKAFGYGVRPWER
jgi:hypothetical protein